MKLWGTSRTLGLFIVAFGLLTFFYPSITTDRPVAGISRWSPFEIVRQSYNDALPRFAGCQGCSEPGVRVIFALPFDLTMVYLLLLIAAGSLLIAESGIATMVVAFFGGDTCLWALRSGTRYAFGATFGLAPGAVHYGSFIATQLVVMAALFMVGMDLRDEESSTRARKRRSAVVDNDQPRVMDAEVVRENEPAKNATSDLPRLHE